MFNVTDKVWVALELAVIAALGIIVLVLAWHLHAANARVGVLTGQVADLTRDNGTLRANNATLTDAIGRQNAAVQRLGEEKEAAERAAAAAAASADKYASQTTVLINKLRSAKAATCTEAMPLVRQTLEGLK
jgi:cell division protein FtsB